MFYKTNKEPVDIRVLLLGFSLLEEVLNLRVSLKAATLEGKEIAEFLKSTICS